MFVVVVVQKYSHICSGPELCLILIAFISRYFTSQRQIEKKVKPQEISALFRLLWPKKKAVTGKTHGSLEDSKATFYQTVIPEFQTRMFEQVNTFITLN